MRTYPLRVPRLLQAILPAAQFRLKDYQKTQYALTFDDGPHALSTPKLLKLLDELSLKARFFLLGKQAAANPTLIQEILSEGHSIGSHGYEHLNGWRTNTQEYINNTRRASELLETNDFRPPYGKISRTQYARLKDDYHIFLWSFMPEDYDTSVNSAILHRRLSKLLRELDIVVLHDNPQTLIKLKQVLPVIVEELQNKGLTHTCL